MDKYQKLYEQYLKLKSKGCKENFLSYEKFEQGEYDLIIKVNFTWGWLHVYKNKDYKIVWY